VDLVVTRCRVAQRKTRTGSESGRRSGAIAARAGGESVELCGLSLYRLAPDHGRCYRLISPLKSGGETGRPCGRCQRLSGPRVRNPERSFRGHISDRRQWAAGGTTAIGYLSASKKSALLRRPHRRVFAFLHPALCGGRVHRVFHGFWPSFGFRRTIPSTVTILPSNHGQVDPVDAHQSRRRLWATAVAENCSNPRRQCQDAPRAAIHR